MSEQAKLNDGSLVPAGRRDLAPVSTANPLVSRGLATLDLKNAVSSYLRGVDWYQKCDYEKARNDLNVAIRLFDLIIGLDPSDAFAFRHRGKARWARHHSDDKVDPEDYKNSIGDFDEAIRLEPDNAVAYVERGEARFWGYSGADPIALCDFDKAVDLDRTNAGWLALRAFVWLEFRNEDYDKAIDDFAQAIRLNGQKPDVSITFTKTDRRATAFEEYDGDGNPSVRAGMRINLHKHLAIACYRRGRAWSSKGDHGKAITDFDEAIRLSPTNDAGSFFRPFYFRGRAWLGKKNYDKAIQDFDVSLRLKPKDASAYVWRGIARRHRRSYEDADEAIKDFTKAIDLDPQYADAYYGRALMRVDERDRDAAITDFTDAIRLAPNQASYFADRGKVFSDDDKVAEAIADFTEAIRLDPINAYYHRLRADAHWWTSHAEALEDYDEALRLDPTSATTYCDRGDNWLIRGLCDSATDDIENAIADFEAAILLDPHCFEAYSGRSKALRTKGIACPEPTTAVTINVPGQLFIRPYFFFGQHAFLAKTPAIVEISESKISEAHERKKIERMQRYEKLVAIGAPQIILENELKMLNSWKNASHRPEKHSYLFQPSQEYSRQNEPDPGLVYLASLSELERLDAK